MESVDRNLEMMAQRSSAGRFYGEYPARVSNNDDPEKILRVQVRVLGVHPDDLGNGFLPWAEIRWPLGARPGEGAYIPLQVDDWVWVDFPYLGDPRRPRITGSMHYAPGGIPNLPPESYEGTQQFANYQRSKEDGDAPDHVYGRDFSFALFGTLFEIRKDGSVGVINRETGTEIGITKKGAAIIHSANDVVLTGERAVSIKAFGGPVSITAVSDVRVTAGGDVEITTQFNPTSGKGKINLISKLGAIQVGNDDITSQPTVMGDNMASCVKDIYARLTDVTTMLTELIAATQAGLLVCLPPAGAGSAGSTAFATAISTPVPPTSAGLVGDISAMITKIAVAETMFTETPFTKIQADFSPL